MRDCKFFSQRTFYAPGRLEILNKEAMMEIRLIRFFSLFSLQFVTSDTGYTNGQIPTRTTSTLTPTTLRNIEQVNDDDLKLVISLILINIFSLLDFSGSHK